MRCQLFLSFRKSHYLSSSSLAIYHLLYVIWSPFMIKASSISVSLFFSFFDLYRLRISKHEVLSLGDRYSIGIPRVLKSGRFCFKVWRSRSFFGVLINLKYAPLHQLLRWEDLIENFKELNQSSSFSDLVDLSSLREFVHLLRYCRIKWPYLL